MTPAVYKRLFFMIVALLCALLMTQTRIFRFDPDKGIIYNREYKMDFHQVYVIETNLETGDQHFEDAVSVNWLARMNIAMIVLAGLGLAFCWRRRIAAVISLLGILSVAVYYFFCVYYSIQISDRLFATIIPRWSIIVPIVVLQMFIMSLQSVKSEISLESEMTHE